MTARLEAVRKLPLPDQRKYFAAREIWHKRHERAPHDMRDENGVSTTVTWAQWFELQFKQSLDAYITECNATLPQ